MGIQLGQRVRDRITGFQGIAESRHEYLNGCVRYGIQPEGLDKDDKMKEVKVIDEPQLEVVRNQIRNFVGINDPLQAPATSTFRTGGPRRDPERRPPPSR